MEKIIKKITPTIQPLPKQYLGWKLLWDKVTKYILFGGGAGGGKAQPLSSLILTRNGFVRMGDLKVGDKVISSNNKEETILNIYPQGKQDIYEITFIDGAKIKTTDEHLFDCWVAGRGQKNRKIRTLKEIMQLQGNVIIPLADKLEFGKHYNNIDSYLVGALLGDGGLTGKGITFTTADEEILKYLKVEDNKIVFKYNYNYSIVSNRRNKNGHCVNQLMDKLRTLKIYPIKCENRFIPDVIKNGSIKNRLEVLRGLMDTDGYIDTRGHCSFTSKSKQLALDVQYIVRSLGGKATLKSKIKFCYYKGERKDCLCYEVYINTKDNSELFKLKRKKARVTKFNGGASELGRRIIDIQLVSKEKAQCILITGNHLYISDDFVVTHNTWLGCEWLMTMCYQYPGTKWFIGRKELKRLMQSSYETFKKVCKYHDIPPDDWKLNGQYNYIEFINPETGKFDGLGSRIDLLDLSFQPSDPLFERFGSTEYTGGWIEEAGEVVFKAFDVLKTRIGRHLNKEYDLHPKMLLTANPKKNWLKRIIWKPWKLKVLDKAYAYVQSLYSDNHYTADTYGEQLSEITDKVTKQRLKGGNWDYDDDDNCLIDGGAIQDIWTNTVDDGDKYAVIDVARKGKDKTKLYLFKGFKVYKIVEWEKKDTNITSTEVKEILANEQIPYSHTIADEVGVGGGFIDQMKGINGFIANSSVLERKDAQQILVMKEGKEVLRTEKENFASLKDQCGWMLAKIVNNHKLRVETDKEELKEAIEEELSELKDAYPDEDRKKRLVPKDEIKENIGRSPDDLDCLLMRMWFELSPVVDNKPITFTNLETYNNLHASI